jgi:RNase P protein component
MIISEKANKFINNKLFVVVIKPTAKTLNYQEMKSRLTSLLEKSKLMENTHE